MGVRWTTAESSHCSTRSDRPLTPRTGRIVRSPRRSRSSRPTRVPYPGEKLQPGSRRLDGAGCGVCLCVSAFKRTRTRHHGSLQGRDSLSLPRNAQRRSAGPGASGRTGCCSPTSRSRLATGHQRCHLDGRRGRGDHARAVLRSRQINGPRRPQKCTRPRSRTSR